MNPAPVDCTPQALVVNHAERSGKSLPRNVRTIASARLSDEKTIQQLMMDIGKPATPSGILPTILPHCCTTRDSGVLRSLQRRRTLRRNAEKSEH